MRNIYGGFSFVALLASAVLGWLWAAPNGVPNVSEALTVTAFLVGIIIVLIMGIPSTAGALAHSDWQPARRRLLVAGLLIVAAALLLPTSPIQRSTAVESGRAPLAGTKGPRGAAILAINDIYRIEGKNGGRQGGLARLRTIRRELDARYDVLLLHAGDVISPSLLGSAYQGRQMIDVMNLLDGDASIGQRDPRLYVVFGNHEFDDADCARPDVLRRRVAESDFYWIATNIHFDRCAGDSPMITSDNVLPRAVVTIGGIKVGLFGLTIDLDGKRPYPPIDGKPDRARIAAAETRQLRAEGAETVIALTHLDHAEDEGLLCTTPQLPGQPDSRQPDRPDIIIGGHDHQQMVLEVDGRRIYKADADAATASLLFLTRGEGGKVLVSHRLLTLDEQVSEDAQVKTRVDSWLAQYDRETCSRMGEPAGCLDKILATSEVELEGDEMKIRGGETTLGDVLADVMSKAMAPAFQSADEEPSCAAEADGAFINAGSLRLNTDLPKGAHLTVRTIEELLPYPAELRMVLLSAGDIRRIFANAMGKRHTGGWLQVSGIRVAPGSGGALSISLHRAKDGPDSWINLDDVVDQNAKQFTMVTTSWLLAGGDDYKIDAQPLPCRKDLKTLLKSDAAFPDHRIQPPKTGRISVPSHPEAPEPCPRPR
jgi:2',3'-cyclic-nucleotide 2'-phosphodiesterase (5'-nucleotidase family)